MGRNKKNAKKSRALPVEAAPEVPLAKRMLNSCVQRVLSALGLHKKPQMVQQADSFTKSHKVLKHVETLKPDEAPVHSYLKRFEEDLRKHLSFNALRSRTTDAEKQKTLASQRKKAAEKKKTEKKSAAKPKVAVKGKTVKKATVKKTVKKTAISKRK